MSKKPDEKEQKMRSAMGTVLRVFGRTVDTALLIMVLVCAVRIAFSFSPELANRGPVQKIDQVFGKVWTVTERIQSKASIPQKLGDTPVAPGMVLIGVLFVRNMLNWQIDKLTLSERRRRAAIARQERPEDEKEEEADAAAKRQAAARRVAVASYTEARAILESTKMELTFLSLDVVGSTKMKQGEDPFVIEQAFSDYRKLVERILIRHQAYKSTWTPDGQMAAFKTCDDAVRCGREIITGLADFNKNISKLRTPFSLRVGSHCGVVSTDDITAMEKISDFSIDVTGHLQKHCTVDALWISERLYEKITEKDVFLPVGQEVDGFRVFEWRAPGTKTEG